jgi:UvrD-like helicase C-terminal domain
MPPLRVRAVRIMMCVITGRYRFHGQAAIHAYTAVLPATVQGIQRYLGSGLIKDIGPVMAERMVQRNLLYTGVTRARKLVVLVGSRRALAVAVRTRGAGRRHTALDYPMRA